MRKESWVLVLCRKFVPHDRAQLFTYHHRHPSRPPCRKCRICKHGRLWPLYSTSTETKAHACFFIPASVLVSIVNSRSNIAEPDIINSELKSAFGDCRRADEHPVLAVGLLQCLWCHRPTRNAHLTRMFYMPNQEGCLKANVPPCGVGFLKNM